MGKKINPKIFRLQVNKTWHSRWFAKKGYKHLLEEDVKIRKFVIRKLLGASIASVDIERTEKSITIIVYTAKPGVVIGKGGSGVEDLKKAIKNKFFGSKKNEIKLSIKEIGKPYLNAQVVANIMIEQISKRMLVKRVMKKAMEGVMQAGAMGARIVVSGRINGATIARREKITEGKIPLHTIRADVDYARGAANTIYGKIGIKVYIYKGETFNK